MGNRGRGSFCGFFDFLFHNLTSEKCPSDMTFLPAAARSCSPSLVVSITGRSLTGVLELLFFSCRDI